MKTNLYILVILFFIDFTFGRVINVPGDQATIQAGIDAATKSDTVLVADSTYYENINFKGKAITVASMFLMDQDTSHISKTIIDGSQPTNPDYGSTVSFVSGENTNSVLCGFTITGGTGTKYVDPYNIRVGGGIICGFSGATIRNNYVISNSLDDETVNSCSGGGINSGPPGFQALLIIEKNLIQNNTIQSEGVHNLGAGLYIGSRCRIDSNIVQNNKIFSTTHEAAGGGMLITQVDSGVISNNIVENNSSFTNSDSYIGAGGGAYFWNCLSSHLVIQNNQFINNEVKSAHIASGGGVTFENCNEKVLFTNNLVYGNYYSGPNTSVGGGIYITQNSEVQVIKNQIIGNKAYSAGGLACHKSSNPVITNNLIAFNEAGYDAGGIDIFKNSNPILINNTIVENKANLGGGMAVNKNCDPTIINTIIYGNSADSSGNQVFFWDDDSEPTFLYSSVEGGKADFGFDSDDYTYLGTYKNCLESDPLFTYTLFHLSATSPCIDAGNPDTSALFLPETDLFGNPRIYDGNGDGTTVIDIGIHEFCITSLESGRQILPGQFVLYQNYPNPFNPKTVISYQLSTTNNVKLSIYNIVGQEVALLVDKRQSAGNYNVEWNAAGVASGIYFYRLETDKGIAQIRKMVVLK